MNAFISYSHQDSNMLDMLHKHLAQLKREGIISTWTDEEIPAGRKLNQNISSALTSSNLFIALLSPDYIASNYCYDTEFKKALEMEQNGTIIIIPVILDACDWKNTPFKEFKALPKDGKPISAWENKNTAFLDIIQNIRRLIDSEASNNSPHTEIKSFPKVTSRNYQVEKDFDTIQKLEYVEKTFHEVKDYLKRFIEEVEQLENIKTKILTENNSNFECLLVNRNKINTESQLKLTINSGNYSGIFSSHGNQEQISYSINNSNTQRSSNKNFTLTFDKFHLFWSENNFYSANPNNELGSKEIAEIIWNEWLESVGIL